MSTKNHITREEMIKRQREPYMVGVWNKKDRKVVAFKDGTVYQANDETGAIRRVHPKLIRGKAARKAFKKAKRIARINAVTQGNGILLKQVSAAPDKAPSASGPGHVD